MLFAFVYLFYTRKNLSVKTSNLSNLLGFSNPNDRRALWAANRGADFDPAGVAVELMAALRAFEERGGFAFRFFRVLGHCR